MADDPNEVDLDAEVDLPNGEIEPDGDTFKEDALDIEPPSLPSSGSTSVAKPKRGGKRKYNQRYVLSDGIGYHKMDLEDPERVIESRMALRGELVELTDDQLAHHESKGHVGTKEQLQAVVSGVAAEQSEDRLNAMTPTEVLVYIGQNADSDQELNRVENLERARSEEVGGPREKVLDAIDLVREMRQA